MYAWGEISDNNDPLPQIAPLEGRFNLRYVQRQIFSRSIVVWSG